MENKAPKALRDKKGELHKEEAAMAEIAREHFELIGKGMTQKEGERKDTNERYATVGTGGESRAKEPFKELQSQISYREVEEALKRMKRGKGVGGDKISMEMIQGGGEILWHNIHALLQCCWEEEYIPEDWMEGIIVPLHKGGDAADIGNYRGVTLGSHLGKLFCQILKSRLENVVEREGILGEAQGGFRRDRQTIDQLFVLNSITQLRRSRGKKTWLAFLDLRKAFPSVWREGLWTKMTKLGLGGKFLRICQGIYSKTSARVRVGSTLSRSYQVTTGLREGCVLSPILFSIFIMDLAGELKRKGLGVEIKGHWIGACFFADDIVLVAEKSKELQEMLDLVARFAKDWRMQFNARKCGVLVVGEKKKKRLWKLGKDSVEEVEEYKYLGVWINRQANGFNHVKHLLGKADSLQALVRGSR